MGYLVEAGFRRIRSLLRIGTRGLRHADQTLTVISQGTYFEGTLKERHNILINGVFKGALPCSGAVVINPSSEVHALIEGKDISINGVMRGTVRAEKVRLEDQARFTGDIYAGALQIFEGTGFKGRCFMEVEEKENVIPIRGSRPR